MKLIRRIRERHGEDTARELATGIRRNQPRSYAPADIDQLRRERLYWYRPRYRRR